MADLLHPSDETLIAYLNGHLRHRHSEPVETHLEQCTICANRLSELETITNRDPLVQHVRQAVMPIINDDTPLPNRTRLTDFIQNHHRFTIRKLVTFDTDGPVYIADDRERSQKVVLKIVPAESGALERLQSLAMTMQLHAHVRIVPTLHVESIGPNLLIANQYRAGSTLREVVCSGGRLQFHQMLSYAEQAVEALTYAHLHGLTHGDLRPTDWFLEESGILLRGWDRPRCLHDVPHQPTTDVEGFGRTLVGLLVGQTTLTASSKLPFDEIWSDTSPAVVELLKAATRAEFPTPHAVVQAIKQAIKPRGWWQRWNPYST